MGMTVQVRYGGTETRYRLSTERPDLTGLHIADAVRAAWRAEATQLADEVLADIETAYPKIERLEASVRVTAGQIFLAWACGDDRLAYWEYDTRPHWPPFNRDSQLREWADARGLSAFGVAWAMAPREQGGGGGKPSFENPGRLVATRGQYYITKRVPRALLDLVNRMVSAMLRVSGEGR